MEITPFDIGAVITAIGGAGGLWAWLDKRRDRKDRLRRETQEDDTKREEREIGRLRNDMTEVKRQLDASRAAHAKCEEQVAALAGRIDTIEQHHSSLLARWIKDDDKRIRWVNSWAMRLVFGPLGYSRSEIDGRTFAELGLDASTVTEVDRLDRQAVIHPGESAITMLTLRRVEPPPGVLGELPPLLIAKVAGIGRDGDLIYEGCAFRPIGDDEANRIGDLRQAEQRGVSTLRRLGSITD